MPPTHYAAAVKAEAALRRALAIPLGVGTSAVASLRRLRAGLRGRAMSLGVSIRSPQLIILEPLAPAARRQQGSHGAVSRARRMLLVRPGCVVVQNGTACASSAQPTTRAEVAAAKAAAERAADRAAERERAAGSARATSTQLT